MADDSVRHKLAALAAQAQPEGHVDVFVVAEIPLVEAARLEEQVSGVKRRGPAWGKAFAGWRRIGQRMTEAATPGVAIGKIAVAGAVQLVGFVQADLQAGDNAMRWRRSTARIIAASQSGEASASGLSKASHRPVPTRAPTLLPPAKPRLLSCRRIIVRAGCSPMHDSELSLDALSMTMVSKSVKVCRASDARQPRR